MKSLFALLFLASTALATDPDRSATYQEKIKFCTAIADYFKEQSEGEDARLSLSFSSCRLATVDVYTQTETKLDLEARVIVWIGLIPMPVTCWAEMESGEVVSGSQDCTY